MGSEMCEAVTPADVGSLRCEWRGKPATPRRILGYARSTITAGRALCAHVLLRRIGLHKLLPIRCALLTGILNLFPPLGSLRGRKTSQLTVFATLQGAFSPQLLPRIELLLPLRLQICLGLCVRPVWPCLRGRRELTLALGTQLLSLNVPLLPNVPLLLLNVAVDHRRRLMTLGRRKIWPRPGRRCRARDVRCGHLRGLRSCDLRWRDARSRNVRRGARCHLRRSAGCHLWRGRPRGRGRGSCRRSVWCRTGFGPWILCGSCHRNGDGQCGGQGHASC